MKLIVFQNPTEDRPKIAVTLLLIGVFTLAFQDTLVKYMTSYTTFWQFQTIRSTFIVSLFIQPLESVTYTMYNSLELTSISGFSTIESSS